MTTFIIALESEARPLIELAHVKTQYKNGLMDVYTLEMGGRDYCAIICGVGKVNAACAAEYALSVLRSTTIVNFGMAGGLHEGLKVGAIYAVSRAVQYDFDLVQLNGGKIGTLNEFSENYLPLCLAPSSASRAFGAAPSGAACNNSHLSLATADRFNDSAEDHELLLELGADLRDMEGGAIAQVCAHKKAKFYCFKAVSDIYGQGATTDQFVENTRLCAQNLKIALPQIIKALA